jgi:large subunit ribosomal protein L22
MDVNAKARYIHMSPRKVRLVVDVIRGMDVARARDQLRFMKKAAAGPVLKLLNSAAANAKNNFHLSEETLFVKTIAADGGPALKRWTPKAFGRAAPIKKRLSHISIVLADRASEGQKRH